MQRPVSKKQSRSSEVIYYFSVWALKTADVTTFEYLMQLKSCSVLLAGCSQLLAVNVASGKLQSISVLLRLNDYEIHEFIILLLGFLFFFIYIFPSARSEERFSPLISLFSPPPRPISFLRPFKPLSINLLLFCQFVSVLFTVAIILQMSAIIVSFIPSVRFRPHSVKNIEERRLIPECFFFSLSLSALSLFAPPSGEPLIRAPWWHLHKYLVVRKM